MRYVYARWNGSVGGPHGSTFDLKENEVWDASDPVVVGRPDAFSDQPIRVRTSQGMREVVEAATAAPGQRRRTP